MAGIDAGEGAAAAPPPELSPQQRIEQVRRVLLTRDPPFPATPCRSGVAQRWLPAVCCFGVRSRGGG